LSRVDVLADLKKKNLKTSSKKKKKKEGRIFHAAPMMSTSSAWTAHKFGGTSVANADCYKR